MAQKITSLDLRDFTLSPNLGPGPEDVLPLPDGTVLTGVEDGRVFRVSEELDQVTVVCSTNGRPLGLDLLPDGSVLICDAVKGLLRLDLASGELEVLVDQIAGKPLILCNNSCVARDGTIYFSVSTSRHPDRPDIDVCEYVPTGRLFCRHPDGQVQMLADGFYFANGVTLSPDESHVLIAETGAARVQRHWLSGQRAGQTELFLDDLPGLPDNLNLGSDGLVWMAMVHDVGPLRSLWKLPIAVRWLIARLPQALTATPDRILRLMAFDFDSRIHHDIAMADPPYHFATSVRELNGVLFLASIRETTVARVVLS